MYNFIELTEDEKKDIDYLKDDAFECFLKDSNLENISYHKVVNNEKTLGYIFNYYQKYCFYQKNPDYFIPNNLTTNDNGKVINFDIIGDYQYIDDPIDDEVSIVIRGEKSEKLKTFSLGFNKVEVTDSTSTYVVVYSICDYISRKCYSFIFSQSRIKGDIGKRDIIVPTRLNKPVALYYLPNIYKKKYYFYQETDISINDSFSWPYYLGVKAESKGFADFINNWQEYKYKRYPDLHEYLRYYLKNNDSVSVRNPFLEMVSQEQFLVMLNSLNDNFHVPDLLLNFYNRKVDKLNELQNVVDDYQKVLKLHK